MREATARPPAFTMQQGGLAWHKQSVTVGFATPD
jgi:hypothetical protein